VVRRRYRDLPAGRQAIYDLRLRIENDGKSALR
jgi:hypothetical protein